MEVEDVLDAALKLQSLIVSGSLEVSMEGLQIIVTRDDVVVDIQDPERLLNVASPLMEIGKDSMKGSGRINVLEMLRTLESTSNKLAGEKKTVFLEYRGQDVVVMGYKAKPGIVGPKNIEIRGKLQMVRLVLAFLKAWL
ncbi:hypothetical protein A3L11_07500 [Thermococcus siculi]|uniref:Uncharacterized protein n=1 Tax=Thermococcus siculi TaxID=72803 RepID=A0A2Z2MYK3_9EURY|nr:hypothetical protein A3L11_07500 [Thermococcus siculi]